MQGHLFFVCPTDYLESVINDNFKHVNYFVGTLGNSVVFDDRRFKETIELIEAREITEITFVLSDSNSIVLDAIKQQDFISITGLDNFYQKFSTQTKRIQKSWGASDYRMLFLSYHLTKKVDELLNQLNEWQVDHLKINAQIYYRQKNVFKEVMSDLLYRQQLQLN